MAIRMVARGAAFHRVLVVIAVSLLLVLSEANAGQSVHLARDVESRSDGVLEQAFSSLASRHVEDDGASQLEAHLAGLHEAHRSRSSSHGLAGDSYFGSPRPIKTLVIDSLAMERYSPTPRYGGLRQELHDSNRGGSVDELFFLPAVVDFGSAPVYVVSRQTVKLTNSLDVPLLVFSAYLTSPQCSVLSMNESVVAPRTSAVFSIECVLEREEAYLTNLHIHTNVGHFLASVTADGVPNPFGVEAVDARAGGSHADFEKAISIYNPGPSNLVIDSLVASSPLIKLKSPPLSLHQSESVFSVAPGAWKDIAVVSRETGYAVDVDGWVSITLSSPMLLLRIPVRLRSTAVNFDVDKVDFGYVELNSGGPNVSLSLRGSQPADDVIIQSVQLDGCERHADVLRLIVVPGSSEMAPSGVGDFMATVSLSPSRHVSIDCNIKVQHSAGVQYVPVRGVVTKGAVLTDGVEAAFRLSVVAELHSRGNIDELVERVRIRHSYGFPLSIRSVSVSSPLFSVSRPSSALWKQNETLDMDVLIHVSLMGSLFRDLHARGVAPDKWGYMVSGTILLHTNASTVKIPVRLYDDHLAVEFLHDLAPEKRSARQPQPSPGDVLDKADSVETRWHELFKPKNAILNTVAVTHGQKEFVWVEIASRFVRPEEIVLGGLTDGQWTAHIVGDDRGTGEGAIDVRESATLERMATFYLSANGTAAKDGDVGGLEDVPFSKVVDGMVVEVRPHRSVVMLMSRRKHSNAERTSDISILSSFSRFTLHLEKSRPSTSGADIDSLALRAVDANGTVYTTITLSSRRVSLACGSDDVRPVIEKQDCHSASCTYRVGVSIALGASSSGTQSLAQTDDTAIRSDPSVSGVVRGETLIQLASALRRLAGGNTEFRDFCTLTLDDGVHVTPITVNSSALSLFAETDVVVSPCTPFGESALFHIAVTNPWEEAVAINVTLVSDFLGEHGGPAGTALSGIAHRVYDKRRALFMELLGREGSALSESASTVRVLRSVRYSSGLEATGAGDALVRAYRLPESKDRVVAAVVGAGQTVQFGPFEFGPVRRAMNDTIAVVRSNVTGVEFVPIIGCAGTSELAFGRNKGGDASVLALEVSERQPVVLGNERADAHRGSGADVMLVKSVCAGQAYRACRLPLMAQVDVELSCRGTLPFRLYGGEPFPHRVTSESGTYCCTDSLCVADCSPRLISPNRSLNVTVLVPMDMLLLDHLVTLPVGSSQLQHELQLDIRVPRGHFLTKWHSYGVLDISVLEVSAIALLLCVLVSVSTWRSRAHLPQRVSEFMERYVGLIRPDRQPETVAPVALAGTAGARAGTGAGASNTVVPEATTLAASTAGTVHRDSTAPDKPERPDAIRAADVQAVDGPGVDRSEKAASSGDRVAEQQPAPAPVVAKPAPRPSSVQDRDPAPVQETSTVAPKKAPKQGRDDARSSRSTDKPIAVRTEPTSATAVAPPVAEKRVPPVAEKRVPPVVEKRAAPPSSEKRDGGSGTKGESAASKRSSPVKERKDTTSPTKSKKLRAAEGADRKQKPARDAPVNDHARKVESAVERRTGTQKAAGAAKANSGGSAAAISRDALPKKKEVEKGPADKRKKKEKGEKLNGAAAAAGGDRLAHARKQQIAGAANGSTTGAKKTRGKSAEKRTGIEHRSGADAKAAVEDARVAMLKFPPRKQAQEEAKKPTLPAADRRAAMPNGHHAGEHLHPAVDDRVRHVPVSGQPVGPEADAGGLPSNRPWVNRLNVTPAPGAMTDRLQALMSSPNSAPQNGNKFLFGSLDPQDNLHAPSRTTESSTNSYYSVFGAPTVLSQVPQVGPRAQPSSTEPSDTRPPERQPVAPIGTSLSLSGFPASRSSTFGPTSFGFGESATPLSDRAYSNASAPGASANRTPPTGTGTAGAPAPSAVREFLPFDSISPFSTGSGGSSYRPRLTELNESSTTTTTVNSGDRLFSSPPQQWSPFTDTESQQRVQKQ